MHAVKKRLENNLRNRKSTRLSVFDRIRNLPRCESPVQKPPVTDAQAKVEHRRAQLEKWKEEKEKKKKDAASQKKKPFVAGVPHNSMKFNPPPPPLKAMPSTSGRVTRSQSAKNNVPNNASKNNSSHFERQKNTKTENKQTKPQVRSFAPKNATFNPILKNIVKLPTLDPPKKNEKKISNFVVTEPNLASKETKSSKTSKPKSVPKTQEVRSLRSRPQVTGKANPKTTKLNSNTKTTLSSTSSSSVESDSKTKSPTPKLKTPKKSLTVKESKKMFTPKNPVPKSESSSEEKLRSPKSIEVPMTPEQIVEEAKKISPCVTLSRGKDNARKEMKKKIDEGLLDDDVCEMDSVEHFRRQLDSEIKRMTEMCETWDKISEQIPLPDAVQEAVLGAVGQARLLMSQKMQQFASLLSRCEKPEPGQALVTPTDLHGFWDMVFMQVENVDMRFKKLEEMRARGWVVEEVVVERRKKPVRPAAARPPRPAATSRLRDMIAAARQAKKEQSTADVATVSQPEAESKTFEAGFFCVQSPVKSPIVSTPSKPSLLKAVLSSEAKKASASKSSASYAMLRASLIGKNVDNEETAQYVQNVPLTPINLGATPARSILKSTNVVSTKKSGKKSIKVVLFDDSDAEVQDESIQDIEISGVQKLENDVNVDSGLSSMDVEKDSDGKENKSRRRSKIVRQDAMEDRSPVMTRSRRKSVQTPVEQSEEKTKRSSRKKQALQEVEVNDVEQFNQTPRRNNRRKSSNVREINVA